MEEGDVRTCWKVLEGWYIWVECVGFEVKVHPQPALVAHKWGLQYAAMWFREGS